MSRNREREPHPDPAIELQLQEILDLRASIDRRSALIEQYREEIADLHKDARYNDNNERIKIFYERADQLDEKIRALEGEIEPVHEQIRELQGKISPDDLAFLGGSDV
jgi:predicted nuclease with TOPRIM domain